MPSVDDDIPPPKERDPRETATMHAAIVGLFGAVALRERDIVSRDEVSQFLAVARELPTERPGKTPVPVHFMAAQHLLRRKDISNWDEDLIVAIAELAALDSARPEYFRDDRDRKLRLAKAIRGAELKDPPASWWRATGEPLVPPEGDKPPRLQFIDNRRWMEETQGYNEAEWGLPVTLFATSSSGTIAKA
jgi:hypothetical protein